MNSLGLWAYGASCINVNLNLTTPFYLALLPAMYRWRLASAIDSPSICMIG